MARTPVRLAPEWDARFTGGIGLSLVLHGVVIAGVVLLAPLAVRRPPPLGAYTVELTDPSALGGRLPPGAITHEIGGGPIPVAGKPPGPVAPPAAEPAPPPPEPKAEEAKAEPSSPPKPEPKAETEAKREPKPEPPPPKAEPEVKLAEKPKPEPPPPPKAKPEPEPKPEAKPPAKVAAAKPEPPARAAKPEPEAKPAHEAPAAKPAPETKPAAHATAKAERGPASGEEGKDAYALAAERWKAREGGGLAGSEAGSGPVGAGGEGPGGGGQVVGLEFLAYRQQVIGTIKSQWTNVVTRPGLVARVRFGIASDGTVSDVRLEQSSGNAAYDTSVVRAVEHANPLPPPPARYADQFREFVIEFHSEETGGRGTG
ncbi:MAG TPA: cell envelope integrity protein TolA [Candidatus Binatia bacterium]|nr:cell envelope integrity protein TolA [Candidatus Binatia bacterium]